MILCSNPKLQYLAHKEQIDAAIAKVLNGDRYILGVEVRAFEEEFAAYCGAGFGIGVGSGTDALVIALKAVGITAGDEVITVSHTATATISAIAQTGACAVLVDIEDTYYTIDPQKIEAAITSKTKAIIPVHIYGQCVDIEAVCAIARKYNLKVIEDCAQAPGAEYRHQKVGSFGDLACFSFYPTKNIGAVGDGGMIITSDSGLAKICEQIRQYGWDHTRVSQIPGFNSRLDELQAAILRVKLKYLDNDNSKRQRIAARYTECLKTCDFILPQIRANVKHVFHLYVLRTMHRDLLIEHLKQHGIIAMVHYEQATHQHRGYDSYIRLNSDMKVTEQIVGKIVSLPIYPELKESEQDKILMALKSFNPKV